MPIDLDGMAVLRSISARADLFPKAAQEINELAHELIADKLIKNAELETARQVYRLLNDSDFRLVIDELSDSAAKKLAKKLDPNHPDMRTADSSWCRQQVIRLAAATLDPAQKPPKVNKVPKKVAAAKKPRVKRTLSSKAMSAIWDGKNRDNE